MTTYNLVQTLTTGQPARFSANGKRISRAEYERITSAAHSIGGRMDCFLTRAWPMPCGGTKRKNYSTAVIQE